MQRDLKITIFVADSSHGEVLLISATASHGLFQLWCNYNSRIEPRVCRAITCRELDPQANGRQFEKCERCVV
jgi:hypothetical protein